jgi:hypothetical protein
MELVTSHPEWADIQVSYASVYLGVSVGPGSQQGFWDKAVQKFVRRAGEWTTVGLGLQHSIMAYAVYVLPILSFLAQFKIPDGNVLKRRRWP